jgi:hypothetical protein
MKSKQRARRGGKRPGAGRPPKAALIIDLEALAREEGGDPGAVARKYAVLAVGLLRQIIQAGTSENARVAAAKVLLNLAVSAPTCRPPGKKERAATEAQTAGHGTDWDTDLETPGGENGSGRWDFLDEDDNEPSEWDFLLDKPRPNKTGQAD